MSIAIQSNPRRVIISAVSSEPRLSQEPMQTSPACNFFLIVVTWEFPLEVQYVIRQCLAG